ncbi:glutamate ABC transporter substrate-binding protein [Ornithinimicrobium sp. LYQ92]|uniref:glutamate ABC transporter substrate-binding protein n=1 Tax=Serinicoccus sp. LYQ92 TaxID=3378798 RepID=UPI0038522288
MRSTTFRIAALASAAAFTLAACGGDDDGGGGEAGSGDGEGLTVGIKYDQPGLGLMEGSDPTGFDVDVAKAVADKLGVSEDDITWQEAPTPQREDLLVNESVDMIFATYSITDERKERVQFSGPYFVAGQDLLVAADDTEITGPDTLEGKILCSVAGSTPAERVAEEYPGVQIQEFDTYSLCVENLSSGQVDALTTDDVILAGYAAQSQWEGQFQVVGAPFSEELYGVGLNQDDERCEEINTALEELYEDGTMDQIIEDNFGAVGYTPSDANPPEIGGHCA